MLGCWSMWEDGRRWTHGWNGPDGRDGRSEGTEGGDGSCDPQSSSSLSSKNLFPEYSANAALVLIGVACSLLDRQTQRLALDFEKDGGFTERLYRVRSDRRRKGGR